MSVKDFTGCRSLISRHADRRSRQHYGGPRDPGTWQPYSSMPDLTDITDKGYTGQQMLDAVGLIHMNGRVYDPGIGKFISADPTVPDPLDSQSFNRYAYVYNNPLNSTDPSGYDTINCTTGQVEKKQDGSGLCTGSHIPGVDTGATCMGNCGVDSGSINSSNGTGSGTLGQQSDGGGIILCGAAGCQTIYDGELLADNTIQLGKIFDIGFLPPPPPPPVPYFTTNPLNPIDEWFQLTQGLSLAQPRGDRAGLNVGNKLSQPPSHVSANDPGVKPKLHPQCNQNMVDIDNVAYKFGGGMQAVSAVGFGLAFASAEIPWGQIPAAGLSLASAAVGLGGISLQGVAAADLYLQTGDIQPFLHSSIGVATGVVLDALGVPQPYNSASNLAVGNSLGDAEATCPTP